MTLGTMLVVAGAVAVAAFIVWKVVTRKKSPDVIQSGDGVGGPEA